MLKIYDQSHQFVGHIVKYKDCQIESDAATGDKALSFTYTARYHNLKNEYYIRTETDEYVIKEIEEDSSGSPRIVAMLNREALQGRSWQSFSVVNATIDEAARLALAGTGWTVGECGITKRRNAGMPKATTLTVIENLCTAFMCEPVYDTIGRTVSFYEKRGEDRGAYFMSGLNLRKLSKKTDSNGFFTQIIPIGRDGMTINEVNGGQNYLENHQYSDKVIQFIWTDESYTDPQALKDDAEAYLADKSKPYVSYSADVADLAAQKPEYSVLSYGLGDTVRLIDRATGTQEEQRIVRMVEYPQEPEKNTCELANTVLTFEEMQEKLQAAASLVDNTMTSDGKIRVSDILGWEKGLAENPLIGGMQDSIASLSGQAATFAGQLGALSLTVGSIETNYLKAEDAELRFAKIDLTNIEDGCIKNAMIGIGAIGTAQIADGAITDAKIVELTANKITAGTLSVERLEIRGSKNSIVYALNNITGALQAQNVDTLNGEILTPRTITADRIVANSITGSEIAGRTITANHIVANSITSAEIAAGAIKAVNIDVTDLFAQSITATGTISGVKLVGGSITTEYGPFSDSGGMLTGGILIKDGELCSDKMYVYENFNPDWSGEETYKLTIRRSEMRIDHVIQKYPSHGGDIVLNENLFHLQANGSLWATALYEGGAALASKYAAIGHTHDERYYTESEVNSLLAGKAAASHTHADLQASINALNTNIAGFKFAAVDCGTMPAAVGSSRSTSLPSGFTSGNTFIVAFRVLRSGGVYVYSNDGFMCNAYLQNNNTIVIAPTQNGVTYCANQSISAIIARV